MCNSFAANNVKNCQFGLILTGIQMHITNYYINVTVDVIHHTKCISLYVLCSFVHVHIYRKPDMQQQTSRSLLIKTWNY